MAQLNISLKKNIIENFLREGRSVARSSYCYFLSNSFFIGVKYKKTNIAPEFAIPNPSSTYVNGSIALGGESKINTKNTINNLSTPVSNFAPTD